MSVAQYGDQKVNVLTQALANLDIAQLMGLTLMHEVRLSSRKINPSTLVS